MSHKAQDISSEKVSLGERLFRPAFLLSNSVQGACVDQAFGLDTFHLRWDSVSCCWIVGTWRAMWLGLV